MAANVDGVRPTSGVGPATGAGPADTTRPDANATGKGLHASQGGHMRSAQKTSGPSVASLPEKTRTAIREARTEVNDAKFDLTLAGDHLRKNPNDADLRERYAKAKTKLNGARANLGQVIAREADRSSPRSSLVPKEQRHTSASRNPPPSVTKMREFEAKVVNDTPLADRDEVAGAILKSEELRIVGELALANAAMKAVANTTNPHLNASQTAERKSIIADATESVTQPRQEEVGLARKKVTENRLDRWDKLLDSVTTRVDGVTGQDQKFDPFLYDWLIGEVRKNMGELDEADRQKFDGIVASYRARLAPRY